MNIKDVYLCKVYINSGNQQIFVEKTLAYWKKNGIFIDLDSGIKYRAGFISTNDGEYFVSLKDKMESLCSVIDSKKKNLSRRKILKKYKEVENGGRKE